MKVILRSIAEKKDIQYINKGFYCENCKDWELYNSFSRLQLDDTVYRLEFSRREIDHKTDSGAKSELLYDLDNLSDRKEQGDKIFILGKAEEVYGILQKLIAINASYNITPPFIHKIEKYREFDEELIREILEMNKKYSKYEVIRKQV